MATELRTAEPNETFRFLEPGATDVRGVPSCPVIIVIRHSPAVSSEVSVAAVTRVVQHCAFVTEQVPSGKASLSASVPLASVVVPSSLPDRRSRVSAAPPEGLACFGDLERATSADPVALPQDGRRTCVGHLPPITT